MARRWDVAGLFGNGGYDAQHDGVGCGVWYRWIHVVSGDHDGDCGDYGRRRNVGTVT